MTRTTAPGWRSPKTNRPDVSVSVCRPTPTRVTVAPETEARDDLSMTRPLSVAGFDCALAVDATHQAVANAKTRRNGAPHMERRRTMTSASLRVGRGDN